MPITYTISLSQNQIIVLKAIQLDNEQEWDPTKGSTWAGIKHFVVAIRGLILDKYVREETRTHPRWGTFPQFVITEKGELVLKLIEMEVVENANVMKMLEGSREVGKVGFGSDMRKIQEANRPTPEETYPPGTEFS